MCTLVTEQEGKGLHPPLVFFSFFLKNLFLGDESVPFPGPQGKVRNVTQREEKYCVQVLSHSQVESP